VTVRIEEMTHTPAPTAPETPVAGSVTASAPEATDPAKLVAALRRERDRSARLWAD
jgi:hypothetical protein